MGKTLTYHFGEALTLRLDGEPLPFWPTPWGELSRVANLTALRGALTRRGQPDLAQAWEGREIYCPDLWDWWLTALALPLASLQAADGPVTPTVTGLDLPDLADEIGLWADQMKR